MRLLTATRQEQGNRPGDFCFAIEGELVVIDEPCATDRADADGGCGCGRAFAGMSSLRATTTALVRDLDVSPDDVRRAVEGYHASAGVGPDVVGEQVYSESVAETLDQIRRVTETLPEGAVVGRRLNHLYWRFDPTAVHH